jgi:sulfite reductase alpha subunit-like flavoprotein
METTLRLAKSRSALILYGSETGNTQDVAREIARLAERLRFDTTVIDLDSIELVRARILLSLLIHSLTLFLSSTA